MLGPPCHKMHTSIPCQMNCLLLMAGLLTIGEAYGDGGSVLARKTVGKETYVLLGNQSGLRVGMVDLDLIVEGKATRGHPLEIAFGHPESRGSDFAVAAKPELLGKVTLFKLHVELQRPGIWTMTLPAATGEQVQWTIAIRDSTPVPWRMAAWYLWPVIVVIVYAFREMIVRSRSGNPFRPRMVKD